MPKRKKEFTFLELMEQISEAAKNDDEVLATVTHLVNSGRVRFGGEFSRRKKLPLGRHLLPSSIRYDQKQPWHPKPLPRTRGNTFATGTAVRFSCQTGGDQNRRTERGRTLHPAAVNRQLCSGPESDAGSPVRSGRNAAYSTAPQ